MRYFSFAIMLCATLASAQERFPYEAFTNEQGAAVRSGPGRVHYETDRLDRGSKVEVHRHDPGGWYAVRPPEGSFSWVKADAVSSAIDDGVAGVLRHGARAWVGSRAENVSDYLWQVRLRQDELVEVIGERRSRDPQTQRTVRWLKITPPAGEFRWIHESDLSRTPPPFETTGNVEELDDADKRRETQPPPTRVVKFEAPIDEESGKSEVRQASAIEEKDGEWLAKKDTNVVKTKGLSEQPPRSLDDGKSASDRAFTTQLHDLEIELSLSVSKEPVHWQLVDLRRRANALVAESPSIVQRKQARTLLAKIREFESLQRRRNALATSAGRLRRIEDARAVVGMGVRAASLTVEDDPDFDGVGWLMPVHSPRRGMPSFALMSDDGTLVKYVTPSPGFNLHRYVRMKVGIRGKRGYIPELKVAHLTAHRAKVLDRGKNQ